MIPEPKSNDCQKFRIEVNGTQLFLATNKKNTRVHFCSATEITRETCKASHFTFEFTECHTCALNATGLSDRPFALRVLNKKRTIGFLNVRNNGEVNRQGIKNICRKRKRRRARKGNLKKRNRKGRKKRSKRKKRRKRRSCRKLLKSNSCNDSKRQKLLKKHFALFHIEIVS